MTHAKNQPCKNDKAKEFNTFLQFTLDGHASEEKLLGWGMRLSAHFVHRLYLPWPSTAETFNSPPPTPKAFRLDPCADIAWVLLTDQFTLEWNTSRRWASMVATNGESSSDHESFGSSSIAEPELHTGVLQSRAHAAAQTTHRSRGTMQLPRTSSSNINAEYA